MSSTSSGVVLALCTGLLWAVSPMFMSSAGRRIGSFPTVLLRSLLASVGLMLMLGVYVPLRGGIAWPSATQVMWLVLSAAAGMVLGDVLIYESLVTLGPRRTVQVLTLHPVFSVVLGWALLSEELSGKALVGVGMVIAGTAYAALAGRRPDAGADPGKQREPGRVSMAGLSYALGGAICTALGAITARLAFKAQEGLDPILATAIRVGACTVMLWGTPLARGRTMSIVRNLKDPEVRLRIVLGTFAGAFAGMICYVSALKLAEAGLVSTFVATSPLWVLPMVALRYRARIGTDVIVAASVAVAGVGVIMWK